MADVWWARPVDPGTAPGLVDLLDPHERARLDRFRRPADRDRYLAAHALTRLVLAVHLGADPAALALDRTCRCGEQHGKPALPGGPDFSLTHSGGRVGVALSTTGPVGLDVEESRALGSLEDLVSHVLSPAERSGPPLDAAGFLTVWTRKEALLKATGDGLSRPMDAITLDRAGAVLAWTDGPANAWVVDLDAAGHPAALAGLGPEPREVRTHDGAGLLGTAT